MLARAGVPEADADAYLEVFDERAALDAALMWYRAAARTGGLRAADCPSRRRTGAVPLGDRRPVRRPGRRRADGQHVTGEYRFVEIDGGGHFLTDETHATVVVDELVAHVSAHR